MCKRCRRNDRDAMKGRMVGAGPPLRLEEEAEEEEESWLLDVFSFTNISLKTSVSLPMFPVKQAVDSYTGKNNLSHGCAGIIH